MAKRRKRKNYNRNRRRKEAKLYASASVGDADAALGANNGRLHPCPQANASPSAHPHSHSGSKAGKTIGSSSDAGDPIEELPLPEPACEEQHGDLTSSERFLISADWITRGDGARSIKAKAKRGASADGAAKATQAGSAKTTQAGNAVATQGGAVDSASDAAASSPRLDEASCGACGAHLVVAHGCNPAPTCPYCGGTLSIVAPLDGAREPEFIIPFSIGRDEAEKALRKFARRFLVPLGFRARAKIEHVAGVYVPFWLYGGEVSGGLDFRFVKKARDPEEGEGDELKKKDEESKSGCVFDSTRAVCRVSQRFNNVPADASTKMPDDFMDAIEPYDSHGIREFAPEHLAGYCAEWGDLNAWECAGRAAKRMATSAWRGAHHAQEEDALAKLDADYCVPWKTDLAVKWSAARCVLMPVWMLHVKWKGEDLLLAMNGQTGRIAGELPVHDGKRYGLTIGLGIIGCLAVFVLGGLYWAAIVFLLLVLLRVAPVLLLPIARHGIPLILREGLIIRPFAAFWNVSNWPRLVITSLLRRQRTAVEHSAADDWRSGDLSVDVVGYGKRKTCICRTADDLMETVRTMLWAGDYSLDLGRESFAKIRPGDVPNASDGQKPAKAALKPPEVLDSSDADTARRFDMWDWRDALRRSEWRS